jgi:intracellular septation protein
MKLFFDLFPIILFFITYKFFGIFMATGAAMAAVSAQVIATYAKKQKPDLMQWITLGMILVLGGSTLLLQNELFIKWKPTAVYWILGIAFASSQWIGKTNLVQKMLGNKLTLPSETWQTLNIAWSVFFLVMGFINLAVVYYFDTDTWVNFKLFGTLVLTIVFMVLQGMIIYKHLPKDHG